MKEIVRLKIKFLFYNMAIVTAVIGVTFFAAAAVVKSRSYQETDQILSQIAEGAGSRIIFDGASQVRVPHFSVIVTADGAMLLQEGNYNSFPDQAFLDEVILLGMDGRGETGFLPEYSLKYFREARPEGVFLAFADTSYSETMMESVWQYGAAACVGIWLLFFVLSWFFAGWAVRPLEKAMTAQKEFVANASHELKTPLTILAANTELLSGHISGRDEESDKWLENMKQECQEMRKLVESLLTLARSDAGTGKKKAFSRFDFGELLMEELLTFEPVFYQAGRMLSYEDLEESREFFVNGNREELKQLLQVLLDNAVRYSNPQSATTVSMEETGRGGFCLQVKSHGTPIPKEQREAVFERFYRGDTSRASGFGCGLGLSIAKEIAREHKAVLGLTCEDGANCFYLKMRTAREKKKKIVIACHKLGSVL